MFQHSGDRVSSVALVGLASHCLVKRALTATQPPPISSQILQAAEYKDTLDGMCITRSDLASADLYPEAPTTHQKEGRLE